MKLHEKAKELGVKSQELIKFLQERGHTISSFNQNLSEDEDADSNGIVSVVDAKLEAEFDTKLTFDTVLVVPLKAGNGINDLHEVVLLKMFVNGDKFEVLNIIARKTLPNRAQASMIANQNLARINSGLKPHFD